jgi:hydroxymethylpyrimidine pyrophosphatase-like HAD family hydrolase
MPAKNFISDPTVPETKRKQPLAFIILDLDGVIVRHPLHHTINEKDYSVMRLSFTNYLKAHGKLGVITNRPPSEMQCIAYFMGVDDGIWITESGGSAYDIRRNASKVLEQWQEYAQEKVPNLRYLLKKDLGIDSVQKSFEEAQLIAANGSVKTVIVPPDGVPVEQFAAKILIPYLQDKGLLVDFCITTSKAIDIDPRGLSKGSGIKELLKLNEIDPEKVPTLFIADHIRDIEGARKLKEMGGKIAAVGNADKIYKEYIREEGGFLAPENSEYHNSVSLLMQAFLATI